MVPAPINPDPTSTLEWERMQKQLDRDIREMVSALVNRLAQLQQNPDHHVQKRQQDGSSHLHQHLVDHENTDMIHGVRIVTLGGSNTGAIMRGEYLDDTNNNARAHGHDSLGHGGPLGQNDDEDDGLGAYVNSNFQAINNSIMLAGSYSAHDPGVHLDISDFLQHPSDAGKSKHHKKEKEISRSDHHQHSEPSSE